MEVIIVKTQQELDVLPLSFTNYTDIEIRSSETIKVTNRYVNATVIAYDSSTVRACDSSTVRAYDSSTVTAYDSSTVIAYDSSTVIACDSSTVIAYGSSTVTAYDSSTVTAYDSSTVTAYDSSTVTAYGSSTVTAYDSSTVTACDSSTVIAYDSSTVRVCDSSTVIACDSSTVIAYDSSTVIAYGSSTVTAYGSSTVRACDSSTVTAYDSSTVIAYDSSVTLDCYDNVIVRCGEYSPNIFCEKSVTVVYYKEKQVTNEEWLKRGHIRVDGILSLIKSHKTIKDIKVFETDRGYVVKRGNTYSHGDTVEKAIEDLRYKINDRDKSEYTHWSTNKDNSITVDEAIKGYRIITGACELGVKQFMEGVKLPKVITPNVILELTKGHFGHDTLKGFIDGVQ